MKRKIITLLAFIIAATTCSSVVGAYDSNNVISPIMESSSLYLISIQTNTPTLSISGTEATITVQYKLSTNCTAKVSTALQKSSTGSSWSKVQGWSDTDSGSGTHTHTHNTSISGGYYYRVSCTVSTYDSSGKLIETNTAYSNSIYCPST